MMFLFALALFFGAIFVKEDVRNDIRDRPYTPGDVVAVFFGMLFAAFSLGMAGPNFRTVTKGRQAAYAALQTIERIPEIQIDDETAEPLDKIDGEIRFEKVTYKYKS